MPKLPLGGKASNYGSKKNRGMLINMLAEGNTDGSYVTVKRADGLTSFATGGGAIRSNILTNGDYAYWISGSSLYRVDANGAATNLGTINGSGQGQILANSVPGNNQILALNGSGLGYIYNNSGLTQITDSDFYATTSGCVLAERFWFVRDGTNEVFGSAISNGFTYDPLTFFSAEESPDLCRRIVAKKSSIWVIGSSTMEFWQSTNDVTVPLRKVRGATIERGIHANNSLAEVGGAFIFLADDLTVRMVDGNTISTISDLDFTLKLRGDGTALNPGLTTTTDAIGFFVDGPTHKIYYITFPTSGYTWGYDLSTGLTHTRKSLSLEYWRAAYATNFNNRIIIGDLLTSTIWTLTPDAKAEGSDRLDAVIRTPGISHEVDVTIPLVELDVEVGETEDPTITPVILVRYTRDGGYNWINHSDVSLGGIGDHRARVPIRRLGRLVRKKDFMLELTVTQAVRFQLYDETYIELGVGI